MLLIYVFGVQPAEPTPTWVHRVHTSSPDYRFWPQPPHLSAANFSQPAIPHSLALNSRSASKISTVATSSENFGCHALDPVWHLHLADQIPENNHIGANNDNHDHPSTVGWVVIRCYFLYFLAQALYHCQPRESAGQTYHRGHRHHHHFHRHHQNHTNDCNWASKRTHWRPDWLGLLKNCPHLQSEWRQQRGRTTIAYILKASPTTPTGPKKNWTFRKFVQICHEMAQKWPKMPQSGPNMTQNGPTWP